MTEITWNFVRRTLERLRMIEAKIDARVLAEELARRGCTSWNYSYLSDVWDYMRESGDPNAHPHGACDHCGAPIYRDSNAARFCSNRCRQSAYRLRLKQRGGGSKRNRPPNGDASTAVSAGSSVTPA